jgi:hypothetical protein
MPPTHYTTNQFFFEIPQGGHFSLVFPTYLDVNTGLPFDFVGDTEGTWIGRMQIRDKAGTLLATLHSDPGTDPDGTITFDDDGHVTAELPSAFTTALTPTSPYAGTVNGTVYADLEVIDPADNEVYRDFTGAGSITQEVTSA